MLLSSIVTSHLFLTLSLLYFLLSQMIITASKPTRLVFSVQACLLFLLFSNNYIPSPQRRLRCTFNVNSSGREDVLLILSLLPIKFLFSLCSNYSNMELFLQIYDQIQGIDHSGCVSAHESPNASYIYIL